MNYNASMKQYISDDIVGKTTNLNPHKIIEEVLKDLKKNYPKLRIAQWFLDPLNKKGPDFNKNKQRILNKIDFVDKNFLNF